MLLSNLKWFSFLGRRRWGYGSSNSSTRCYQTQTRIYSSSKYYFWRNWSSIVGFFFINLEFFHHWILFFICRMRTHLLKPDGPALVIVINTIIVKNVYYHLPIIMILSKKVRRLRPIHIRFFVITFLLCFFIIFYQEERHLLPAQLLMQKSCAPKNLPRIRCVVCICYIILIFFALMMVLINT